jgi:hypothetical protein
MKRTLSILAVGVLLLVAVQAGLAQDAAPLVIIHRAPDTSAPPEVRAYVSVIDRAEGKSVEGLTADDFVIEEAGATIGTKAVSYETAGVAVVIVVDRGGISAPKDGRITEATGLAEELINRLSAPGGPGDDMVAVVGIGEDKMEPEEDFSFDPVDTGRAKNALIPMTGEEVSGGTPLYEGLDEALRLLTENPDAKISDALSRRRKLVVVFSDGIDPDFSETARYDDVIRKAVEADISIYTVGMAKRDGGLSAEDNLKRLARQTNGIYQLHNNDETHQQVLNLFDNLMTQRHQYLITYETRLPKGDYTLRITVSTPAGTVSAETPLRSVLLLPQISLTAPADGESLAVDIAYDETPCLYAYTKRENFHYLPATISLSAQVTPVDGAPRAPARVRYFANGELIGTSSAPPSYELTWDVTAIVTPTAQIQVRKFTLVAKAEDAYLGEPMETQPVTVEITWAAAEQTECVEWELGVNNFLTNFWWVICVVGALALGLLVLFIMLVRTRGELARKVVTRTTGVLKGVTKRLGRLPEPAPGKLVVIQGANIGKEFRIAAPVVKVGRDPQFCDFALYDDYVSNPHFSVQLEQTRFFIVDEGSTNGTRVNGVPIPPQRRIPLQPDAIIEAGNTRLQFKRVGGTTRQLGRGVQAPPAQPPLAPSGPAARPSAPQQPPQAGPAAPTPRPGGAARMPSLPPAPQQPPQAGPAAPTPRPGVAARIPSLPPAPPQPERGGPTVKLPVEEVRPERGGPTVKLPEEEVQPERGGPTVKLPEEEVQPERGGPTVKLPEEEVQPERGGPTVKLPEEEARPERGGPTVKLPEEEVRPEPGRDATTVRLSDEELQESRRGGPTVKLTGEEEQPGPEDIPTVKLPRE